MCNDASKEMTSVTTNQFTRPLAIGVSDLVVGCFSIESLISVGLPFGLFFTVVTQKSTAISCTACCFVCNSVQFCSCTTSSNELPHLLPSSRARCALVHGIRCWLETSSHVLFGLPSHRALATAALSALPSSFCVTFGLSAHSLRLLSLSSSPN